MPIERPQPTELHPIIQTSDSHDILAHGRQQAAARGLDDYFIVDVDSHIGDGVAWPEVIEFIENDRIRQEAMSFGQGTGSGAFLNDMPGLQWQSAGGRIPAWRGVAGKDHRHQRAARGGADAARRWTASRLTTRSFSRAAFCSSACIRCARWRSNLATAYNRWLVEQVLPHEPRMKAMLYLPFNTPEAAERMVKRFLGAPGVAGFLVTSTRYQPVHANEFMRLYAMLEEAQMLIGFHAHHNWHNDYTKHLNRFLSMHALSFVLSNLVHCTNWVINGLPSGFRS